MKQKAARLNVILNYIFCFKSVVTYTGLFVCPSPGLQCVCDNFSIDHINKDRHKQKCLDTQTQTNTL